MDWIGFRRYRPVSRPFDIPGHDCLIDGPVDTIDDFLDDMPESIREEYRKKHEQARQRIIEDPSNVRHERGPAWMRHVAEIKAKIKRGKESKK